MHVITVLFNLAAICVAQGISAGPANQPSSAGYATLIQTGNHTPSAKTATATAPQLHPVSPSMTSASFNNYKTQCPQVQYDFPDDTNADISRADLVKQAYRASWDQYKNDCMSSGYDEIFPINGSCKNDLFGWGASIVDGIDTAIIMNMTDIVTDQLAFIANIDFTKPNNPSNPDNAGGFDSTIRYLGGLLSSYDLLTGGFVANGTYEQQHVEALLSQAVVLANKLAVQFDTPSGLPASQVNFATNQLNDTNGKSNCAVAGSIVLEYYRLSDLTGNQSYRQDADRAESYLINPNPAPFYPYLVGSELDINSGNFLTFDFGWKAGIDSFLEYLVKTYVYDTSANTSQFHLDFWNSAVQSSMDHIALNPQDWPELTFLSQGDDSGNLLWQMDDYACFAGGNILLGGKYQNNQAFIDFGLKLTDSCHHLYNSTVTGLGMSTWNWFNATGGTYNLSWTSNPAFIDSAEKNGYFILPGQSSYGTYPETIESIWYAYRITGDTKWQDYNWEIFQAILAQHNATVIYDSITDVNVPLSFNSGYPLPAFYFAEVLKYLYLSFVPPDVISLDEWVFNTESHPFLRQAGCGYDGRK